VGGIRQAHHIDVPAGADRQRARQWRTVFGQLASRQNPRSAGDRNGDSKE
jgi:hypothetical protein